MNDVIMARREMELEAETIKRIRKHRLEREHEERQKAMRAEVLRYADEIEQRPEVRANIDKVILGRAK